MIILLSPAKTLDYSPSRFRVGTQPRFVPEALELAAELKKKKPAELKSLMSVSDNLAAENYERYQQFEEEFTSDNSKQAILAFKGDVYQGLETGTLSSADLDWAQNHIRILSGLYGVLRPRDFMQPYRLEMGTRLKTRKGKNLYQWWGNRITQLLNDDIKGQRTKAFFNLASNEYFDAVDTSGLDGALYSAHFLENRNGENKFISYTAKRARGWLCRFMIDNRIDQPEGAKAFDREGFHFVHELSSETRFTFVRYV